MCTKGILPTLTTTAQSLYWMLCSIIHRITWIELSKCRDNDVMLYTKNNGFSKLILLFCYIDPHTAVKASSYNNCTVYQNTDEKTKIALKELDTALNTHWVQGVDALTALEGFQWTRGEDDLVLFHTFWQLLRDLFHVNTICQSKTHSNFSVVASSTGDLFSKWWPLSSC